MSKNKKKVCFLIPSVKSGGIETYLLRFLNYLNGSMEVTVLVRGNSKGELFEAYTKTGVRIVIKPLGYFNLSSMYWYYRFFKREKFDTVCDFNANFAGLPMFLTKVVGTKKRITFYRQSSHHFNTSKLKLAYTNLMNHLVYWNSTAIYSNSEAAFQFFFKEEYKKDTRFKVIKNGVNIQEYLALENYSKSSIRAKLELPLDKFIIGHTGRFAEAKNHYFLLDVASKLIAKDKTIYIVLIGNETEKLVPYINKLNISENVRVLGFKKNIPEYLRAFDLFFFPSITEGQPNALIEAMVAGLPVVASNISSILECFPKNSEHILIDPNNVNQAFEMIQEAMKNLNKSILKQHATNNFDSKVQFKIFRDCL